MSTTPLCVRSVLADNLGLLHTNVLSIPGGCRSPDSCPSVCDPAAWNSVAFLVTGQEGGNGEMGPSSAFLGNLAFEWTVIPYRFEHAVFFLEENVQNCYFKNEVVCDVSRLPFTWTLVFRSGYPPTLQFFVFLFSFELRSFPALTKQWNHLGI